MTNNNLLKAFKEKARHLKLNQKDVRFQRTMAFLKAKGLLDTNLNIKPHLRGRLKLNDVLWAARNVEPRIIEVLPAAMLHFPKNFTGIAPQELKKILVCIQHGDNEGPDFEGLEYKKMKFWANTQLKDKRTKPVQEKRQPKAFRLNPKTLAILNNLVKTGKFKDQTQALEAAVEGYSALNKRP